MKCEKCGGRGYVAHGGERHNCLVCKEPDPLWKRVFILGGWIFALLLAVGTFFLFLKGTGNL